MGAAVVALAGFAKQQISAKDAATIAVKGGRFLYLATAGYITVTWYAGWRAQRVEAGSLAFPFPGLSKTTVIRPGGADDAPDAGVSPSYSAPDTGTTDANASPGAAFGPSPGAPAFGGSLPGLVSLGKLAQSSFHLTVTEHPAFGGVHPVHAKNSFHYKGRAFDASGSPTNMAAFGLFLQQQYGGQLTELIYNGTPAESIKNGRTVPPSFWGAATWAGHRNHVHVAI